MGKDEEEFQEYQKQQQDVTRNLPKDWEQQLRDEKTLKEFDAYQKKDDRHTEFKKDRDIAKEDRVKKESEAAEKKRKEFEERAKKVQKAEQAANTIKRNQYDAEKAQEFKDIKIRNEQRIKLTADEQSALLKAKSAPERIQIRQRIEARNRAENERIAALNHGVSGQLIGHKLITTGNIKESIRKSTANTPAAADRVITNLFGNTVERMTKPVTPAVSKQQTTFYKGEMKQMSKVVNRRQVTTGPVKQIMIVHKNDIMANPDFMSSLLGEQPLVTQTAKNKKAGKPGVMSKLDKFVSSL